MAVHSLSRHFQSFFGRLNPGSSFEQTASSQHNTIRGLIEDPNGAAAELSPTTFLQGSYRQQTAIYTINDVDIVVLCNLWYPGSPGGGGRSYGRDEIFRIRQGTSDPISVTVRNTPPVLSNGSPSGTLSYGTTSTTLALTTDENATCKYDTVPGTSYASMPNTFTTTGSTSQSTSITGLSSGNSYSYYVRCQDTLGNTDSADYLITFNISSGGGGGGGGGSGGDYTAPSVPSNLAAQAASSSEIDLTWTASTDNVGVTGYRLYRNSSLLTSPSTVGYADTGLSPETSYSYTVAAYDAASNVSAQSSPVAATTLGSGATTDIRFGQNILIDHTVYYLDPIGQKRPYTSAGGFLSFWLQLLRWCSHTKPRRGEFGDRVIRLSDGRVSNK